MKFTMPLLILFLALSFPLAAQTGNSSEVTAIEEVSEQSEDRDAPINKNRDDEPEDAGHFAPDKPFKDLNLIMMLSLLVFGLAVLFFIWMVKDKDIFDSEDYLRLIILSLVILATMILIVAGYDNRQLAPAFGILGTIAGYLLGRQNNPKPPST